MKVENVVQLDYLTKGFVSRGLIPLVSFLMLIGLNFVVFMVVPTERVMGVVQRIFYFHVGAAMTSYFLVGLLFVASVFYLTNKKWQWDLVASAAAEVGFVFCTVVLATGMIWGHSAWNTWWRWEPRLVSFLILWLIMLSYILLRSFTAHERRQANYAAVFGILAAINIPIVIFSVKLLDHSEQLHPEIVANQGLRDLRFVYGLVLANITMIIFSVWLLSIKLTNRLLIRETAAFELKLRLLRKA